MAPVSIDSILSMYSTWGNETYDEDITQLAHALQCAALAHHEGSSEELIAAALLHDIGHLFEIERNNGPDYTTNLRHELTGSDYLSELFPPAVTAPIAMHVEAKRYLAANEAGYFDGLSRGSQRSLDVQGGPFTAAESARFMELEGSADAIKLRRWDDFVKVVGLDVPDFDTWIPLLLRVTSVQ
jgi:phosphonate degradation associated HDIG domain protein